VPRRQARAKTHRPVALVVDPLVRARRAELDRREALDFLRRVPSARRLEKEERTHDVGDVGDVVVVGVKLGNEDLVLGAGVALAERFPGGRQLLAVAAPRCVDYFRRSARSRLCRAGRTFDEHILRLVGGDLLELVGDEDVNGAVVGRGDRLALNAGCKVSGDEAGNEGADRLGGEGLGLRQRVLEHCGAR
jgi:hypothetical protein